MGSLSLWVILTIPIIWMNMTQVIRNTANIANKVSGVKHKQTFSFNFVLLRHLEAQLTTKCFKFKCFLSFQILISKYCVESA